MKKLILLALAALVMVGCDKYDLKSKDEVTPQVLDRTAYVYDLFVFDSCEYIDCFDGIAHKGNCRYCAERRKQELKELIGQLKKGE